MAEDKAKLATWNNQAPDDKNLEALSVLITQLVNKIQDLEKKVP